MYIVSHLTEGGVPNKCHCLVVLLQREPSTPSFTIEISLLERRWYQKQSFGETDVGATDQGMGMASRSWKNQGNPYRFHKEHSPANTFWVPDHQNKVDLSF